MWIKLATILSFLSISVSISAQSTPEALVQKQLDAYNNRDIDAFMQTFHENAALFKLGETEPWAQGHDQVRSVYEKLFNYSPELQSKLLHRIVLGNQVIDHEYITGGQGSTEPLELVMIYVVEDGKIIKAYSLRK